MLDAYNVGLDIFQSGWVGVCFVCSHMHVSCTCVCLIEEEKLGKSGTRESACACVVCVSVCKL